MSQFGPLILEELDCLSVLAEDGLVGAVFDDDDDVFSGVVDDE